MEKIMVYPKKTQIIIRHGIGAETCKKLAGTPRPNDICGFILVRLKDYKKVPKNIDAEKVIDEAIALDQNLIEGKFALSLLRGARKD